MTNYNSLEDIYSAKRIAFQKIHQQAHDLIPAQANFHPSGGGWSISEIMEHLAIAESQMLRLIVSLLKKTEAAGRAVSAVSSPEISLQAIFERSQSEKYKTQGKFFPTGTLPLLDSLNKLQEIQEHLNSFLPRLKSVDLTYASFPHWIFGQLNLGQWLAFIGIHEERHLAQIESILDLHRLQNAKQPLPMVKKDELTIVRTNSSDEDFMRLVKSLDADLQIRDGEDHPFYAQYNKLDNIQFAVVAYWDEAPVGCGAIKLYDENTMEVKRMFVNPEMRGKGIATEVLLELENWTRELNFKKCILETGKKQPEAIRLYEKNGYKLIPNFGQYKNAENSVCFEKDLSFYDH